MRQMFGNLRYPMFERFYPCMLYPSDLEPVRLHFSFVLDKTGGSYFGEKTFPEYVFLPGICCFLLPVGSGAACGTACLMWRSKGVCSWEK